jgi:pimeloyl-ACP methyl ester carboxylesterase
MRMILLTSWIALFLSGCAAPTPPPVLRETGSAPAPSLPPAQPAEEVEIEGARGLILHGTWRSASPEPTPAVLLLHMYARGREDWSEIAEALSIVGIASLAIDLRGHGETGGAEDWALALEDVAAAQAWMDDRGGVDPGRRGTVGASIGANLALANAVTDPSVAAVALLSPGLDYFRVQIEGLMSLYGERPILLAASEKDRYSADTVQTLADEATGPVRLLVYTGGAHGTQLFSTQADLQGEIVAFLVDSLAPSTE